MSTQDYKRLPFQFLDGGMNVNDPVDRMVPGKYPFLKNIRAYMSQPIQGRPGLSALLSASAGTGFVHTMHRLNDDLAAYGTFLRIYGIGSEIYTGNTVASLAKTGFSGNPLTVVPYRPNESAIAWAYLGDSTLMQKVNSSAVARPVGYHPPVSEPIIAFAVSSTANSNPTYPQASIPHTFINKAAASDEVAADWTQTGTAGAPALLGGKRVNTTVTAITYDSGTTGWACIQPASIANINPGTRLFANSSEYILVESVHPGSATATTIGSVIYDSGTTGLCSIQLTIELDEMERDAYLSDTTVGEKTRILSVTEGPDGRHSLRVSTAGTFAIGDAISILPSFRAVTVGTIAATQALVDEAPSSSVTAGTGHLTNTLAIDLSHIAAARPTQLEDWFHIALRFDVPSNVTEFRIAFDVDSATNDFTRNFYYFSGRPSDFEPSIRQLQTAVATTPTAVGRDILDETDLEGSSDAIEQTGDTQWYEIWFRVSDLVRVGTDLSRTLANVAAVRLSFTVTGTTACAWDSIELLGSYGPDIDKISDGYFYRHRIRDSTTGARSRWSQPTRSSVFPRRQRVQITVPGHTTAGIDKIDFQRFGGSLTQWTYVGTVANDSSGANVSFNDDYSDTDIAANPTGEDEVRMPFPVQDQPQSGTGYSSGSTFIASTGSFNTNWVRGTTININGIDYTVAAVLTTSKLQTIESTGTQGTVGSPIAWYCANPVIEGAPLPSIWGPLNGFIFGCGDTRNQGWLYFCAGNDPDSAPETHKIEVTSPSEPLMNGFIRDSRCYVFSSAGLYPINAGPLASLYSPGTENKSNIWTAGEKLSNTKGLFSRWAMTADGPSVWYLAEDGIYEVGNPVAITAEDLYQLFPHDGQPGSTISLNGATVVPPQMTLAADSTGPNLRLSYYECELFFDYFGTDGNYYTLVYNTLTKDWCMDSYARKINLHYGENGHGVRTLFACGQASGNTKGMAYTMTGTSDDGDTIACQIRTNSADDNDPAIKKLWGDDLIDCNPNSVTVTVQQGFDQHGTTLTAQTITGTSRTRNELSTNSGAGQEAYNHSLDISWSTTAASPQLFGWEIAYLAYPRELLAWQTLPTTHGFPIGYQHVRDGYFALISNAAVTLTVNVDGTSFAYTLASTSGNLRKIYVPFQVMKGKTFSYRLSSASVFRFFVYDSGIHAKPWKSSEEYSWINPFGQGNTIV